MSWRGFWAGLQAIVPKIVNLAGKSVFHTMAVLVLIAVLISLTTMVVSFVLGLFSEGIQRIQEGWSLFVSILETALQPILRQLSRREQVR